MALKEQYTPDEWNLLRNAIFWVFHFIAEVDGQVDGEEIDALFNVFQGGLGVSNELAREVVADISLDPQGALEAFQNVERSAPMGLKLVADLLAEKTDPETARAFSQTMVFLGTMFARASDDVLGETKGSRISEQEQMAIIIVAAILRLNPEDLMV
jgi:hypothetical protein